MFLDIKENFTSKVAKAVLPIYPDYQELHRNHKTIVETLDEEEERFCCTEPHQQGEGEPQRTCHIGSTQAHHPGTCQGGR